MQMRGGHVTRLKFLRAPAERALSSPTGGRSRAEALFCLSSTRSADGRDRDRVLRRRRRRRHRRHAQDPRRARPEEAPAAGNSLATSSRLEGGAQGGCQVGAARERAYSGRCPALAGGSRAQAPQEATYRQCCQPRCGGQPPQEYSTTRWPRLWCSRLATRRSSSRARARRRSWLKEQRAAAAASGRAALSAPPNPRAPHKRVGVGAGQRGSERASADGGRLTRRDGRNSAQPRRGAQRGQAEIQKGKANAKATQQEKPMLRQPNREKANAKATQQEKPMLRQPKAAALTPRAGRKRRSTWSDLSVALHPWLYV
jgi:hypothetical protein